MDGENQPQEKGLKSKRSLKRLNTFVDRSNSYRRFSGSKKWSKDFNSEILQIADDLLPKLSEEGEAIGIITLEDVIEELLQVKRILRLKFYLPINVTKLDYPFIFCSLQEEIYDETDHRT